VTILSIENSGALGSLAVVRDSAPLAAELFSNPRGRGTGLFCALQKVVRPDLKIDLVLVGTGPGSYNGLRSATAVGWGIAKSRGIPVRGVCSLLGYDASEYCVVGDARAGQWFFARIRNGVLVDGPRLIPHGELPAPAGLPVFSASEIADIAAARVLAPSASLLALHTAAFGEAAPIYLKPPHITTPSTKQPPSQAS
jgi:tRNA A37 threonylcarbamoyladenosine modification protein TsaB